MKNQKKLLAAIFLLFLILVYSGCGKLATDTYDMEDYCTQEDESVYDFSQALAEMENVIATAMYGNDSVLLYEELAEGNVLRKKIWLFSYLTGEKKLCSEIEETLKGRYVISSEYVTILSSCPLVLWNNYSDKIYIYSDDFSVCSTITLGKGEAPMKPLVGEAGFYFMDTATCKVYKQELAGLQKESEQIDYETFRDEAELVVGPDVYMADCSLDEVSKDGNRIRLYAENLYDNQYYYFIYNVQTCLFEEMYCLEDKKYALWNSWDYEQYFAQVKPSAVARYRMIDYEAEKSYETKIEPEILYSYVECDANIVKGQEKILFYVIDEEKEKITEYYLWDYKKAEAQEEETKVERMMADMPGEIDYNELTKKAEKLEAEFGINILMGENVACSFEAYDYKQVTDEERIWNALEELELAMDAFPDGMCAEMTEESALGFNVYLCGSFSPKNKENISDAGAFFVFDHGYYNLAMNIMLDNTEANVIHEMTHAIDYYFGVCGGMEELEADWQACNPEGFEYLNSYFDYEEEYVYTFSDVYESTDDIYFCDTYAKTFPGEDRSRVFEYFGSEYYENDWVLQCAPLRRKARLLLDYCTEYMECFSTDETYGLKTKSEDLGW